MAVRSLLVPIGDSHKLRAASDSPKETWKWLALEKNETSISLYFDILVHSLHVRPLVG